MLVTFFSFEMSCRSPRDSFLFFTLVYPFEQQRQHLLAKSRTQIRTRCLELFIFPRINLTHADTQGATRNPASHVLQYF